MSELRTRLRSALDRAAAQLSQRKRLANAFRRTWDDPDGRLVMRDILERCGLLEEIEEPCDRDTRSVRSGRRMIAIHIFERLRFSDIELAELAREQENERMASITEAA